MYGSKNEENELVSLSEKSQEEMQDQFAEIMFDHWMETIHSRKTAYEKSGDRVLQG